MNTFLKNSLRTLGLLLIINLAACSSSDNDYNDSDNNPPNEGAWEGWLTFDGNVGAAGAAGAVVDEDGPIEIKVDVVFADGRVMIIPDEIIPDEEDDDLYMYSGTYEYSDSDGKIGGDALEYGEECSDFNCEATGANMSFKGAVDDSGTMHLEFDLNLKEGDDLVGTIELEFVPDDDEGSALSYIEGTWEAVEGLTITVVDGAFDNTFTDHSCNLSGKISILDPEYNLYDALSVIYDCDTPNSRPLNGDYIGFAAVEYGDVPEEDMLTIIGSNEDFMLFIELIPSE